MIKVVIFDIFETLITERNSNKVSSTVIAGQLGIQVSTYGKLISNLRDNRYRTAYNKSVGGYE